jgi:hypothetical protein
VLVDILLEECGDRLAPPVLYTGLPPSRLPSPDELRGKFLVKARKRRAAPHETIASDIVADKSTGNSLRASDRGSRFSEAVSAIRGVRFQSAVRKLTWLQAGFRLFAAAEPIAPVAPEACTAWSTAPRSWSLLACCWPSAVSSVAFTFATLAAFAGA